MENIKLTDLTAVAGYREIAKALGLKSHSNISYWLENGDKIPAWVRVAYKDKDLPNDSKDAMRLYRKALRHMRQQDQS
jgi:hypothetical protein